MRLSQELSEELSDLSLLIGAESIPNRRRMKLPLHGRGGTEESGMGDLLGVNRNVVAAKRPVRATPWR